SRRVVRVPRGDEGSVRTALQGARAVGLGPVDAAAPRDQDASREAPARGRSRVVASWSSDPPRQRRGARARAWMLSRTPIAARFAIIADPPTLMKGKGIPVIGAIPIVMPTLTKIWNMRANTIPPATISESASPATAATPN